MSDAGGSARAFARAVRTEVGIPGRAEPTQLVEAAFAYADVEVKEYPRGRKFADPVNARLEREASVVWVADDLPPDEKAAVLAHELGHLHLHDDPTYEDSAADRQRTAGQVEAEGYSPREVKERQADAFAAEFLCPTRELRARLASTPGSLGDLAAAHGVPVYLMSEQVIQAMLEDPDPAPTRAPGVVTIRGEDGAPRVLLVGGPGSGKTAVLTSHAIKHLDNVGPASLMLLTARDEGATRMRRTLVDSHPKGHGVWVGSVRALATEILAKWPEATGRTPAFRILETPAALALLGRVLGRTTRAAPSPARIATLYRTYADARRSTAEHSSARATASPETAEALAAYEAALIEANAFDVPGLVPLATEVMTADPRVGKAARSRFRHVIVDDVQDMTPAELALLRQVLLPCRRVTLAGDVGHSIRGHAGAHAISAEALSVYLSVELTRLDGNRRASPALAGAVARFAAITRGTCPPTPAGPRRDRAMIPHHAAVTVGGEADALAERVEAWRREGVPYSEQVVVARTHDKLRRVSASLRQRGLPVRHLGDMIGRPEVEGLLDWLRLTIDADASALRRVASRAPYGLDAAATSGCAAILSDGRPHPDAKLRDLVDAVIADGTSAPGLRALASHVAARDPSWSVDRVLLDWLLRSGTLAAALMRTDGAEGRLALVAMHVVIRMAAGEAPVASGAVATVSGRLRRAGALDQPHAVLATALAATTMDAVLATTVHAAAGCEFAAAHVVGLDATAFPLTSTGARWPSRCENGRLRDEDVAEAATFGVAISRASERMAFYSANADDTRRPRVAPSSPYLSVLGEHLTTLHAPRRT